MPEAREQHLGSSLKQRHYRQEADACVPPVTTAFLPAYLPYSGSSHAAL